MTISGDLTAVNRGRSRVLIEPAGFAEAIDELVEPRKELLREAQLWLTEWERHRRDVDRGRLLQTLDALALLIRT